MRLALWIACALLAALPVVVFAVALSVAFMALFAVALVAALEALPVLSIEAEVDACSVNCVNSVVCLVVVYVVPLAYPCVL